MSAAIQERLQLSRMPLDKWSKREQLCLASAVSCSGDQNWITVSRTLKSVCGNGNETRPADWYSQKNCAVQYGRLLETVETTKRKKRSSEGGVGVSSPATVEPPTELLLRRLTEERQLEIKTQMRCDQEEYSRVFREIEALQSDELSEQKLQEMWQQIENQQETQRIQEMKLENRMREREQRKKEMVSNWRNAGNNSGSSSPAGRRTNSTTDTTSVDMDVEEIAGKTAQQAAAPSPLLTSLLKSPTSNNNNNSLINASGAAVAGTGSVARATAPTITSLLTSGAAGMPNQPAITGKSSSATAFISRPISGPPATEVHTPTKSPSQAAPTLSMLLEKNKLAKGNEANNVNPSEAEGSAPEQPAMELEQPVEATATNVTAANEDETDPIEEQQLLEVFKHMNDIMDDIDIDMASVIDEEIMKEVEDEAPTEAKAEAGSEDKLNDLKSEQGATNPTASDAIKPIEAVTASSDDSNDNIPLATVAASQDSNQRIGDDSEPSVDNETACLVSEVAVEEISLGLSSSSENKEELAVEQAKEEEAEEQTIVATAMPEAEETIKKDEMRAVEIKAEEEAHKEDALEEKPLEKVRQESTSEITHDTDEEECSSLTDSSKQDEPMRKAKQQSRKLAISEESKAESEPGRAATPQPPARAPLLRKLPHRERSESPMIDDDTATASDHSTARNSNRRRCSSTPIIDSIPNSPTSSEHTDDRRETRGASKKMFLAIYSTLYESKYAAPFRRAFHDEHKYAELCLRPMDLPSIKRNIDSGYIRSISELQRDVLLMCHNVMLIYKPQMTQHKMAQKFLLECQAMKEFAAQPEAGGASKPEKEKEKKARSGSRKSQRHH